MNGLCGPHCKKPLTKITQSKGQYNTGYRFGIVLSHYLMSEVKPYIVKQNQLWTVGLVDQGPGDLERGIRQTQRLQFPRLSTLW